MKNLIVLYRLSDNGYPKEKFGFATKIYCLKNFMRCFPTAEIHLLIDTTNLKESTIQELDAMKIPYNLYVGGSSAASVRYSFDYALNLPIDSKRPILMQEDDYISRAGADTVLLEGLQLANYVSLYDHADKFISANRGGNAFIEDDGGELTKVYRTKSAHWKLTNSTTMTFALTKEQLLLDRPIWDKYIVGTHPHDFEAFIELRNLGRSLISPIPGFSTHAEPQWASPGIDWETV